jgi:predicted GIY-YIG superfamily endonuclease
MLVYKEVVSTKSDALKREAEIKKLNRKDKLVLISKESQ